MPIGVYERKPLAERFWAKVEKTEDCWNWLAGSNRGYGAFWVRGRNHPAPRVAWELTFGPVPPSLLICHHCDNPRCVKPAHLFLGTYSDNERDKVAKSRHADRRGEKHPLAILSEWAVRVMRRLHSTGNFTGRELARMWNVSPQAVYSILKRVNWIHL